MQLPDAKFRQFLCKTLEVLFDLMCSYHTMMTWHQKPVVTFLDIIISFQYCGIRHVLLRRRGFEVRMHAKDL